MDTHLYINHQLPHLKHVCDCNHPRGDHQHPARLLSAAAAVQLDRWQVFASLSMEMLPQFDGDNQAEINMYHQKKEAKRPKGILCQSEV